VDVGAVGAEHQVDVRITAAGVRPAPDHHERAILATLVDQVVAVGASLGPGGAVSRPQNGPAIVLDQHRLAFEHDEQLILAIVPVALRRPGAGLEHDVAGAEIGQPGGRREPPVPAATDVLVEWRRVARAIDLL
jgi:hypothetical protein